jgi:hypothetical protein
VDEISHRRCVTENFETLFNPESRAEYDREYIPDRDFELFLFDTCQRNDELNESIMKAVRVEPEFMPHLHALANKHNVNERSREDGHPLICDCARSGHIHAVLFLIEHNADISLSVIAYLEKSTKQQPSWEVLRMTARRRERCIVLLKAGFRARILTYFLLPQQPHRLPTDIIRALLPFL